MPSTEETTTVSQVSQVAPAKVVKTTRVVRPDVVDEPPQEKYDQKKVIFRFYQFVWYVLGAIETLLVFRIILKAFGANPASLFVDIVYVLSDLFVLPFRGMFRTVSEGESIFELSTFVGGFVYLVIAYGLVELVQFIKPTTPEEVEENV
jgi:hypothetical protein